MNTLFTLEKGAKIQVTCHPGYDCAEVRGRFLVLIQGILKKTLNTITTFKIQKSELLNDNPSTKKKWLTLAREKSNE